MGGRRIARKGLAGQAGQQRGRSNGFFQKLATMV
jgi:hypothetical protein